MINRLEYFPRNFFCWDDAPELSHNCYPLCMTIATFSCLSAVLKIDNAGPGPAGEPFLVSATLHLQSTLPSTHHSVLGAVLASDDTPRPLSRPQNHRQCSIRQDTGTTVRCGLNAQTHQDVDFSRHRLRQQPAPERINRGGSVH